MRAPLFPVYVISKGRSDCCLTARFLIQDGIDFRLVIEPQEADLYAAEFGAARLIVLPFSNLGQGSIPARNFVWEHAKASGAKRHWILDDNIRFMFRRWRAKKIRCEAGLALRAIEGFVERYENIGIAGLNYDMFAPNGVRMAPFWLNVHAYSCLLIDNALPNRWRGRYNEDTDLCLQVLAAGLCTVLFNAFLIFKMPTMHMKGGNTDSLYQGDGRLKMARALERAWPHVVDVKRRFNRPQHVVRGSWAKFDTQLRRRTDIDFAALVPDEHDMKLQQLREIESPELQALVAGKLAR